MVESSSKLFKWILAGTWILVRNSIANFSTVTKKNNLKNSNVNMTVPDDRLAMFCVANFMAFLQIADIFSFWSRQTDGEKDRQRPLVWLKIQQYFQIKLKGSIQINDLQWSVNYFHGMLQREVAAGPRLENQNRVFFWQLLLWKYSQKKCGAYPGYVCMHPGFSFPFKYPKSSLNPFCSLKQNGAETATLESLKVLFDQALRCPDFSTWLEARSQDFLSQ